MKDFLEKIKGSKTVIINAASLLLTIIDQIVGAGFLEAESAFVLGAANIVGIVLRFFTDSPIFKGSKKEVIVKEV